MCNTDFNIFHPSKPCIHSKLFLADDITHKAVLDMATVIETKSWTQISRSCRTFEGLACGAFEAARKYEQINEMEMKLPKPGQVNGGEFLMQSSEELNPMTTSRVL